MGCAPELGDVPPIHSVVPKTGNCKVILANTKDVDAMMCPEGYVALGVLSLSPTKIRCAEVDAEC